MDYLVTGGAGFIGSNIAEHLVGLGHRVRIFDNFSSGKRSNVRAFADKVILTTDDGSYGEKGLVIDPLKNMIAAGKQVNYVLAIGPIPMMRAVANVTRELKIKTVVSLNPIMVDGTGMCGGCRVQVAGRNQFACVDGPEFDAHQVDFDTLTKRNAMYRDLERKSLEQHQCKLEGMVK